MRTLNFLATLVSFTLAGYYFYQDDKLYFIGLLLGLLNMCTWLIANFEHLLNEKKWKQ